MKELKAHIGLLAIAAVIVLYLLLKKPAGTVTTVTGVTTASPGDTAQPYPNAQPIGKIEIGGSPVSITYNTIQGGSQPNPVVVTPLPGGASGATGGGGCCDECDNSAGVAVTVQNVPANVYKQALKNFEGFQLKIV